MVDAGRNYAHNELEVGVVEVEGTEGQEEGRYDWKRISKLVFFRLLSFVFDIFPYFFPFCLFFLLGRANCHIIALSVLGVFRIPCRAAPLMEELRCDIPSA